MLAKCKLVSPDSYFSCFKFFSSLFVLWHHHHRQTHSSVGCGRTFNHISFVDNCCCFCRLAGTSQHHKVVRNFHFSTAYRIYRIPFIHSSYSEFAALVNIWPKRQQDHKQEYADQSKLNNSTRLAWHGDAPFFTQLSHCVMFVLPCRVDLSCLV